LSSTHIFGLILAYKLINIGNSNELPAEIFEYPSGPENSMESMNPTWWAITATSEKISSASGLVDASGVSPVSPKDQVAG
jgi:hypothetical protein